MNCILIDDDIMSRRVIEEFSKKIDSIQIRGSFDNAFDALNFLRNSEVAIDLLFLDIEMPEMNGMDLLDSITTTPQVIIISSKEKYAIQAFNYSVTDYLLKPLVFARFAKAVSKAEEIYNKKKFTGSDDGIREIFIKKGNTLLKVRYCDLLWVEAMENYIVIKTKTDRYTVHLTLKSIESQLPQNIFKRVHRSYIVNIEHVLSIEDNAIVLRYDEEKQLIPIGKSFKDRLLNEIKLINK